MSIGIVLRHTYEETCEICDKIAEYIKVGNPLQQIFYQSRLCKSSI